MKYMFLAFIEVLGTLLSVAVLVDLMQMFMQAL